MEFLRRNASAPKEELEPKQKPCRRGWTFVVLTFATVGMLENVGRAAEGDPPPHALVGQRFVPSDVDRQRPAYQTNFDEPSVLKDWRLEGGKGVSIASGKLVLESHPGQPENHLVCWLTKEMPAEFLLEFTVRPRDRKDGLNIVFFSTRGVKGENIFDSSLQSRTGIFRQYHSSDLNGYHISYWAGERGTANVRKNAGFKLVATGPDRVVQGPAEAFQTIRVYKRGGTIRLTVDDIISVAFDDDGKTHGPVWNHSGWIGLRQMGHTVRCEYDSLAVYPLKR
jgi:hypothetical protein